MTHYLDNEAALAVETTRQRQEREELERLGEQLAEARSLSSQSPGNKKYRERVARLSAAMNLLQRKR